MNQPIAAPGYAELKQRVAALAPLIATEAEVAERERHMSGTLYEGGTLK